MGFVPRLSWKGSGLTSCINCMKRSINLKNFGFRAKIPKVQIGMISKGKMHKMHAHIAYNMTLVHNQASYYESVQEN
jgi:hypothetical protein